MSISQNSAGDLYAAETISYVFNVRNLWYVAVYAGVAVVLTVCALLLYRSRHMETAGDLVAVKVMRPVFKYGVAICAGLSCGYLTSELLGLGNLGLCISVIIWGVAGCIVAQMLLDKTVRVFKKWKGPVAVVVIFLALFAFIAFDVTGYETYVPEVEQVKSVRITGLSGEPSGDSGGYLGSVTLTDPEDVAKVIALHKTVVTIGEDGEPDRNGNDAHWNSFTVYYILNSGREVRRSYHVSMGETMLPLAQAIRDDHDVRRQAYRLDELDGARLNSVAVNCYDWSDNYEYVEDLYDAEYYGLQAEALWDAVMLDFELGRIGVHTLAEVSDWEVTGYVNLVFNWQLPDDDPYGNGFIHVEFTVQENSINTRMVLEELLNPDNRYQDDPADNPLWRSE